MLFAQLLKKGIRRGSLTVIDATGRIHRFGDGGQPAVAFRITDKRLHWRLLLNAELAFGEGYMDGKVVPVDCSIRDLIDFFAINFAEIDQHPLRQMMYGLGRILRVIQHYNPIWRAQRNVAHHYNLSDDLYRLFLDSDRQYSCAYFMSENDSLQQAQENKKKHIAAKLLLMPGQKVLDIGSGWGGLGLYLARLAQVDVTGVTLSVPQQAEAERRARESGLANRVKFLLRDYREESDRYDRVVSVGMFEHVGSRHYREFFRKLSSLLKDDGVALLHSIGRMEPPGSTNAWLRKYIFPGGYSPALSEVLAAIEDAGLWVTDIEILRMHYAHTLAEWHRRFQENRSKIAAIYDERFCRMWEFYLVGCEISFRRMNQMVFQIQIAKRQDAVPLTRDYITDAERSMNIRPGLAA
jgi:cyclopropane-fatty-acyl-phospholipid synthase